MGNNTIKCPFCLKESQRGVYVCTGCMATALYRTNPGQYAFMVILLTFGVSILIGMSTGMAGATIPYQGVWRYQSVAWLHLPFVGKNAIELQLPTFSPAKRCGRAWCLLNENKP